MKRFLIYFIIKYFITAAVVSFCYWGCINKIYPFNPSQPKIIKYDEIKTRQDAIHFLLTKFSVSELLNLKKMAQDGLTSDEKNKIKEVLKSRLNDEEYNAIYILLLTEVNK